MAGLVVTVVLEYVSVVRHRLRVRLPRLLLIRVRPQLTCVRAKKVLVGGRCACGMYSLLQLLLWEMWIVPVAENFVGCCQGYV